MNRIFRPRSKEYGRNIERGRHDDRIKKAEVRGQISEFQGVTCGDDFKIGNNALSMNSLINI